MRTATVLPIAPAQQRRILAEAGFQPRTETLEFKSRTDIYDSCVAAAANAIEARGGILFIKPMRNDAGDVIGVVVGEMVPEAV